MIAAGIIVLVAVVKPAELMPVDIGADASPHPSASFLVEAEVNPTIDARIVDVVRDLLQLIVVQHHTRHGGVRQGDGMVGATEKALEHRPRRVASGRMSGREAWETGCSD